jgi:general secretion pathway protein G
MRNRAKRGFTLVEILIVVVILGILAAIVIPQFSQASTDAKVSSLQSNLQSIRSAIALYKIQHNDVVPAAAGFEDAMLTATDIDGAAWVDVATSGAKYGPYLQVQVPNNPFTNGNDVETGDDWLYAPTDSDGDGNLDTWDFTAAAPYAGL